MPPLTLFGDRLGVFKIFKHLGSHCEKMSKNTLMSLTGPKAVTDMIARRMRANKLSSNQSHAEVHVSGLLKLGRDGVSGGLFSAD